MAHIVLFYVFKSFFSLFEFSPLSYINYFSSTFDFVLSVLVNVIFFFGVEKKMSGNSIFRETNLYPLAYCRDSKSKEIRRKKGFLTLFIKVHTEEIILRI